MPQMPQPWLSMDVYVYILNQLPVGVDGDDSSTKVLSNCCQANSQIREAALLSSIWEPHYRARYTFSVSEREFARKEKYGDDWRLMFYDRRRLDRLAVTLLDGIIEKRSDRTSRARKLCMLSLDIWNALDCETQCAVPEIFRKHSDRTVADTPATYALTRRYWAKEMQGVIARHNSIGLWAHLRLQDPDNVLSFEEVLAGISTFFGHEPSQV